MKKLDLTGQRFERLVVIGEAPHEVGKHARWRCKCDCGNVIELRCTSLTSGTTKSCGCYNADKGKKSLTKHGMYYHSSYQTWRRMMTRCYNPNSEDYPEYGGRGITVCERWHDVKNFIEDMGVRPKAASIDRIENDKGYQPGNCRWSNPVEQANNTRKNVHVEVDGKRVTIAEAARTAGVKYKALHYLIHTKKMPSEAAIEHLKGSTK